VRTNRIFPYGTAREMVNVHLYFVKLFGCHIAGNNIPLDIAGFSDAIMRGKPHPNVYLRFGCGMTFAGKPMTGMSDMWLAPVAGNAMSTFATWFYCVGGFGVNAMFAADGEKRDGLIGAWHPRHGTTRLTIADFRFAKRMRGERTRLESSGVDTFASGSNAPGVAAALNHEGDEARGYSLLEKGSYEARVKRLSPTIGSSNRRRADVGNGA
jgi:hypothetical protein